VAAEERPHLRRAGRGEHLGDARDHVPEARRLLKDPDLHVVDQESHPPRITDLLECPWDLEAERTLHDVTLR